jgi:Na+-transporting NADH:ubiquinone oxidoreductase subunit NqrE
MITLLIALNGFVFMSMRDYAIQENLLYTGGLITSSVLVLTLISVLQKKKKKTVQDQL